MATTTTTISLNGKPHALAAPRTIATLLQDLGLAERGGIAVEVNEEVIPRSEHGAHELKEGDRVEVVTMMAGG